MENTSDRNKYTLCIHLLNYLQLITFHQEKVFKKKKILESSE